MRKMLLIAALAGLGASQVLAAPHSKADQAKIDTVVAFYNAALNDKDAAKARTYLGDHYTQHNPVAADGVDGFVGFIGFLKTKFPANHSEIKATFVDGDKVILHVLTKRTPDSRGIAIVDIFRLEKGKIVEHWDVSQEIPEKSANTNTMF